MLDYFVFFVMTIFFSFSQCILGTSVMIIDFPIFILFEQVWIQFQVGSSCCVLKLCTRLIVEQPKGLYF